MVLRKLKVDITNKKFGKLLVVSQAYGRDKNQRVLWNVVCECGTEKVLNTSDIKKSKSCGCLLKTHFINRTDEVYNGLLFKEYLGKSKYNCHIYFIQCRCGKVFKAESNDILSNRINSCGCLKNAKQISNAMPKQKRLINYLYRDYKDKAKKRQIFFNLTREEFEVLILKNCSYCGSSPSNVKKIRDFNEVLLYNGIDRVDNNKGYTTENSTSCCFLCNQAKHRLPLNSFIDWIKRVYNNLEKTRDGGNNG